MAFRSKALGFGGDVRFGISSWGCNSVRVGCWVRVSQLYTSKDYVRSFCKIPKISTLYLRVPVGMWLADKGLPKRGFVLEVSGYVGLHAGKSLGSGMCRVYCLCCLLN